MIKLALLLWMMIGAAWVHGQDGVPQSDAVSLAQSGEVEEEFSLDDLEDEAADVARMPDISLQKSPWGALLPLVFIFFLVIYTRREWTEIVKNQPEPLNKDFT